VTTVEGLSQYCRNIVRPYKLHDDFVYITCGYGIYVVRHEQKRATILQTSKVAGLIEFVNKKHAQEHKNLVLSEENQGWTLSTVDCKDADIRFDGITRVIALGVRKLLIVLEKGAIFVMNLIFDQAEIDVAEAQFTQV